MKLKLFLTEDRFGLLIDLRSIADRTMHGSSALICPTFAYNKTLYRFAERDPPFYVIISELHQVEAWIKVVSMCFHGTNTLIILDDCVASKYVKGRVFRAPRRPQCVGADPAAPQYRETFP